MAVLAGLAVSLLAAAAPPAATQTTTVVAAAADAYVDAGSPTTSFGTRTYLWVDGDPVRRGFLRFDVPPLPGPVVRATLSFQVDSGASRGVDVRAVPASDWDEATITHANAPTPAAAVGASSGALTTGTRATVDVTPLVSGAGALTLALTTTTTTRIQLASRELGAATAPQLEIVSEGTPAPDTTPPSTPAGFAVAAVTPTTISTAWSASQDDVGVAGYRLLVGNVVVATTTVTAYTFTGLPCETPHDLAVEAYDAAGNVSGAAQAAATTEACPTVVPAAVETEPVPHAGDAADDPAIWVDPADPGRSVVIGTDKQGGIAVYDLSGAQLEYRPDGLINNVDLRQGVQLGGQAVTLVAASDRSVARRIAVYKLDPATRTLVDVAARPLAAGFEPEGICLYRSPDSGILYAFVTNDAGIVEQWRLFDTGAGTIDAAAVRSFDVGTQIEACVADDDLGHFYVSEEDVGIWKYGAEPDAGTTRVAVDSTGPGGHLVADVEGLAIAYAPGGGHLVASSQGSSSYTVYRREGANQFLKGFTVGAAGTVDRATNTDGIDVVASTVGPAFPGGLLVVHDGTNDGGNQNFKLARWDAAEVPAPLADATPPATPGAFGLAQARQTALSFSWSASPDDVGTVGYRVFLDGAPLTRTLATSYTLEGLTCATGYDVGVAAYDASGKQSGSSTLTVSTEACVSEPVLAGAGDIASSGAGDEATAKLLDAIAPDLVYTAGDNVYESGTATEFASWYAPTWGRFQAKTRPSAGNHEYKTAGASGYFDYFGAAAGNRTEGWYSYDAGPWHVIALNSNCAAVGGCGVGSKQELWLRADLASHPTTCTLAYWHHPRFSSSGGSSTYQPFWQALYDFGADLVVVGHRHNYERFAPQTPTGLADPARGIRQFVAGMGGKSHTSVPSTFKPNSEARNYDTYGVLKLKLRASGYEWQFVPEAGKTFADSGSGSCH